MSEFEVVERRLPPRSRVGQTKYQAIIDTAKSGKAVRVPLNGRSVSGTESTIRNSIRAHGYLLRYRADGDHIICWAEKR